MASACHPYRRDYRDRLLRPAVLALKKGEYMASFNKDRDDRPTFGDAAAGVVLVIVMFIYFVLGHFWFPF